MKYLIIYDGNCNLCVTFTRLLETFDQGKLFNYIPMQNEKVLKQYHITPEDCEMGMILINQDVPSQRSQGSEAAEEIVNLLPMGQAFISAYRALSGMKLLGDRTYEQIRDNRYQWFGKRQETYHSSFGCHQEKCSF